MSCNQSPSGARWLSRDIVDRCLGTSLHLWGVCAAPADGRWRARPISPFVRVDCGRRSSGVKVSFPHMSTLSELTCLELDRPGEAASRAEVAAFYADLAEIHADLAAEAATAAARERKLALAAAARHHAIEFWYRD